MRVVADTNVIVSMLLWGKSLEPLFDLVNRKRVVLCFSAETVDELFRVIAYPHIAKQAEKLGIPIEELLDKLLSASHIEVPYERLAIVDGDESDNRILEVALAARANCVISGDRHLLKLKSFQSIPMYSPTEFLRE